MRNMKQNVLCVIQARFGSTRLPGKVLLTLAGKTVLERVIERASASTCIDDLIVATTTNKDDKKIATLCMRKKIKVYCGSEDDVLDRFYQAASLLKASVVVRITADCPLIDPAVIDKVIRAHNAKDVDYTSNVLVPTYPDGQDVEVFTFEALRRAWQEAKLTSQREHVTPYIRDSKKFKCANVANPRDLSAYRLTLDEKNDYRLMQAVYKHFSAQKNFTMREIIAFLDANLEVRRINSAFRRNEGYLKSLAHDSVVRG